MSDAAGCDSLLETGIRRRPRQRGGQYSPEPRPPEPGERPPPDNLFDEAVSTTHTLRKSMDEHERERFPATFGVYGEFSAPASLGGEKHECKATTTSGYNRGDANEGMAFVWILETDLQFDADLAC